MRTKEDTFVIVTPSTMKEMTKALRKSFEELLERKYYWDVILDNDEECFFDDYEEDGIECT